MSTKCEYCGKYFDGKGCYDHFREEISPVGKYTVYTYDFCCRGHFDAFCNQTSMIEVNRNGLTSEEQDEKDRQKEQEGYDRNQKICEQCGNSFNSNSAVKFTKITPEDNGELRYFYKWVKEGYFLCSQECIQKYVWKIYNERREGKLEKQREQADKDLIDRVESMQINEMDDLIEEAAKLIIENHHASASLIQRQLHLGYNRSSTILDQLELIGIISPFNGVSARTILVSNGINLNQIFKILRQNMK